MQAIDLDRLLHLHHAKRIKRITPLGMMLKPTWFSQEPTHQQLAHTRDSYFILSNEREYPDTERENSPAIEVPRLLDAARPPLPTSNSAFMQSACG
jgi:hypothetical protein